MTQGHCEGGAGHVPVCVMYLCVVAAQLPGREAARRPAVEGSHVTNQGLRCSGILVIGDRDWQAYLLLAVVLTSRCCLPLGSPAGHDRG